MERKDLTLCQLRSSPFHFINLFPPKESIKELVENRSRQGWNETVRLELRFFPTVGMESHLSNTHIVVAMPRTLQASSWKLRRQVCPPEDSVASLARYWRRLCQPWTPACRWRLSRGGRPTGAGL
jgi:hypothetical protein